MPELTLEAAIQWPSEAVWRELQATDLCQAWLRRRIEQYLQQLAPLEQLQRHWFGSAATSLFLQRRAQLDRVVFSILRLRDAELAQELYFRLQAGEADFPQLAHFSEGQEQQLGGRLGPIAFGSLHPLIADLLRRSTTGDVQPPLELEDGQLLILRLDLLMPIRESASVQAQLQQELYDSWLAQEQERLLAASPNWDGAIELALPGDLP